MNTPEGYIVTDRDVLAWVGLQSARLGHTFLVSKWLHDTDPEVSVIPKAGPIVCAKSMAELEQKLAERTPAAEAMAKVKELEAKLAQARAELEKIVP